MAAIDAIKDKWFNASPRERATYAIGTAAALLAVVVGVRLLGGEPKVDPKSKAEANAVVEDLRKAEAKNTKPVPQEPIVEIEPGDGRKPQGPK